MLRFDGARFPDPGSGQQRDSLTSVPRRLVTQNLLASIHHRISMRDTGLLTTAYVRQSRKDTNDADTQAEHTLVICSQDHLAVQRDSNERHA
jgi:hypothetical protein